MPEKLVSQAKMMLPKGHAEIKIFELDTMGGLFLSNEEIKNLMLFFNRQGWISHELDQPIHDLIKRIRDNGIDYL